MHYSKLENLLVVYTEELLNKMKSRKRKRSQENKVNNDENDDPNYVPSSQDEDAECGPPIKKDTISNMVNSFN